MLRKAGGPLSALGTKSGSKRKAAHSASSPSSDPDLMLALRTRLDRDVSDLDDEEINGKLSRFGMQAVDSKTCDLLRDAMTLPSNHIVRILNLYGPPRTLGRNFFWEELKDILKDSDVATVVGGNFNVTREREERLNCQGIPNDDAMLSEILADSSFMDLPLTLVRLDRILKNGDVKDFCASWVIKVGDPGLSSITVGRYCWSRLESSRAKFFVSSIFGLPFRHFLIWAALARLQRNWITDLKVNDCTVSSPDLIADHCWAFFRDSLGVAHSPLIAPIWEDIYPTPTPVLAGLSVHLSEEEVLAAIWSLGKDKAPGSDGLTTKFFIATRSIIGAYFMELLNDLLFGNNVWSRINKAFIALIPNLTSGVIRILSKALALRLKPHMSYLVGDTQCAFLPGRSTHDCYMAANEIIYHCKRSDTFARFMYKANIAGMIKGIDPEGGREVTNLEFADDFIIFTRGGDEDLLNTKLLLRAFFLMIGLSVNFDKMTVTHIHGDLVKATRVVEFLGCKEENFPIKYLGLPLQNGRLSREDWNVVIEQTDQKLITWKGHLLSRGGRLTLINSVLNGLSGHFLSIFRALK
ncbi:hypothetical protein Cni_G10643 [Canna indica]|uniref:Reverse transcriptase domain-containing protein n=1 Tax=Canna indica TaxID=4628 RepID=A0AAQ3K668_9LILI|nr:hypothetical protein Cni_G10643 [Canna indica]